MIKKMVIWFCFFRGYKCPDCDRKYFAIIYIKFEKKRILILQMKIGQMYDITLSAQNNAIQVEILRYSSSKQ